MILSDLIFLLNNKIEILKRVENTLALDVKVQSIPNPCKEAEAHYYNPSNTGLLELGLEPHYMTDDVVEEMLTEVLKYKDHIDKGKIMPRVKWSEEAQEA